MQNNQPGSGEDELIRLLLKRQSELNSLLELTIAINQNKSNKDLFQMLEVILRNYQVGRLRLLFEKNDQFSCITRYGGEFETDDLLHKACAGLKPKTPFALSAPNNPLLSNYNFFIPVYHKSKALAYALIGDFDPKTEMLSNDLNFIQTLINVIVVALENKKLFKQRLETERFQREMELAVEVQNMLIPLGMRKDESVAVDAKYLPHQTIGGDYFDFIRLNKDEFLWCIADVSGKGISAALLMANFQASLRAWATVEGDLINIVEQLNRIVTENTKGEKFITLFLAKYNEKTRKLIYVNAGHNPSILYSNGKAIPLKLGTTMIGAFEELPFLNEGEIDVEPDSMIFNYTDGLMDYDLHNVKAWNEDKLTDFVIDNGHLDPLTFNEKLLDHLKLIIKGNPIDDITLLTLKIV